ncbi:hypothetical protein [Campylobacter troglodytis]|uniref:hypothetical protein n=1 Tax=Campylobacter troglodytis TaxID=654363 RepID=UPI00163BAFEA|nr:hypothetical protein [Campylobacter troglodytis]
MNLSKNSKENSQNSKIENTNAEFTHPQTPSARQGDLKCSHFRFLCRHSQDRGTFG